MSIEPTAEEQHPHHRSARERQRRGPMWGCLKWMGCGSIALIALIMFLVGGGRVYLGSSSFAALVKLRIAKTTEARLGRQAPIASAQIQKGNQSRLIVNDLPIANLPR